MWAWGHWNEYARADCAADKEEKSQKAFDVSILIVHSVSPPSSPSCLHKAAYSIQTATAFPAVNHWQTSWAGDVPWVNNGDSLA